MDIKDFRKLVNDSPIKDKLNNLELILNYPHLESKKELKGIQSIYKFILDQVIGWNKIENIPQYLEQSKKHYEEVKRKLIGLSEYFKEATLNQFDNQWRQVSQQIKNPRTNNNYFVFLCDALETDFIIKVNDKTPNYIQGVIEYLTESNLNSQSNKDYFTGVMLGYEFKNQSDSEILHRRNSEKISLSKVRDKYNEYIVEAEQQLNAYLSDAKENITEHFETVEQLREDKNKSFEDWFVKSGAEFNDFYSRAQQSITDNEKLYREKLRLEAPAEYWKNRAALLKAEGKSYLYWLIGVSTIGASLLFILLMSLGNGFFETAFSSPLKGIKWSIILITIVSLLVFSIKILARLTFSSFHLSRDSEEREQLTHFYLALKKDTEIKDAERQLILQSLFSRADTGLLKEDSSPTMPTSIIEKVIKG